jgi:Ca2+-binding RTX toxin-like protein
MLQVHDKAAFHEDGTPRRKHELEEILPSRAALKVIIGLTLAGAAGYAKNLMAGQLERQEPSAENRKERNPGLSPEDLSAEGDGEPAPDHSSLGAANAHAETPSSGRGSAATKTPNRTSSASDAPPDFDVKPDKLAIADTRQDELFPSSASSAASPLEARQGRPGEAGSSGQARGSGSGSGGDGDGGEADRETGRSNNRRPYATDALSLGTFLLNGAIFLSVHDLLAHVVDPDGDRLTVTGIVFSSGQSVALTDGLYFFLNDYNDADDVEISFRVSDGFHEVQRTLLLEFETFSSEYADTSFLVAAGARYGDILEGTVSENSVVAAAQVVEGATVLEIGLHLIGGAGNDVLIGSDTNDVLSGEAGNDVLDGGAGNDTISGGAGDDRLVGGTGNDLVDAGDGDDIFIAFDADGDDALDGGAGYDIYDASQVTGDLVVDTAAGIVSGSAGNDLIGDIEEFITGSGNDTLVGSSFDAAFTLGDGDDIFRGGDGSETISGGAGHDTYDASQVTGDLVVNVAVGTVSGVAGTDIVGGIEEFITGSGNDTAIGGSADATFTLGDGSDYFRGADGNETVDGGAGHDTLLMDHATGPVTVDLSAGTVQHGTSTDQVLGFEQFHGGSGNDTFIADERATVFAGGAGNDEFVFLSAASAGNGKGSRDVIFDFEVGDRIDLRKLIDDFEETELYEMVGKRKFKLIEMDEAFSKPGQLRLVLESADGDQKGTFLLEGNTDQDSEAEFQIEFGGNTQDVSKALISIFNEPET